MKIQIKFASRLFVMLLAVVSSFAMIQALSINVDAAGLPAEVKGKTIAQVLGMNPKTYIDWLSSHSNDNYYVGTPYRGGDYRNPNGDCKGAYGSDDRKGTAGMNCTGFVWHALYKPTKSSGGKTNLIPAMQGWYTFYQSNNISRRYFSSKSAMLNSGYLDKGDIIWMYNGSEVSINDSHHIGIYWGDGKSDVFWHSFGGSNCISKIKTVSSSNILYVVLKSGTPPLSVNSRNVTLGKGETYKLSANKQASFKSSDDRIASVDKNGKISAKKSGNASITVTGGNESIKCSITVKSAPSGVKLSVSNLTLGKGETYIISESTNSGSYAKSFTWSSSDSKVASVEKTSGNKAKITAKGVGTAKITIKTYNGKTAVCKVTVKSAPANIKIDTSGVILGKGETFTVSEKTNSGSYAKGFLWSSSDTKIATVQKTSGNKAKITAKGIGTAKIAVKTYNGKTSFCKVTVRNAPESVKLNTSVLTLGEGETFTISESTNSGSYANSANLDWSSSDTKVAAVIKGERNKAEIKAVGIGTATVRIKTYNGKTALCRVTVKAAPESVYLSVSDLALDKGESFIISERTNTDSYARNFIWSSSDENVAVVKKIAGNKAEIKASGRGTAVITIRTYNGKTAQCFVTVPKITQ